MNITAVMTRLNNRERHQLFFMALAFAILVIGMMIPDLAVASFDGTFTPNEKMAANVDNSFAAWWKVAAIPAFWLSIGALAFSVLFMGGRGWYIPLAMAAIFLFGETLVDGARALMK